MPSPLASYPGLRRALWAVSVFVAVEFVLVAVAVARYGDRTRDIGWTAVRLGRIQVIRLVSPDGPADGRLRAGDRIVAINGDRRVDRVDVFEFQRFLPNNTDYTMTITRDGVERTVSLPLPTRIDPEQQRLAISLLIASLVWCIVATLVLVFRPEQPVARAAYLAGITLGLLLLSSARFTSQLWLPLVWRKALLLVFPFSPLHLALGFDFYARFPEGRLGSRFWRALDISIFVVCAVLWVTGSLLLTASILVGGPEAYLTARYQTSALEPWAGYVAMVIFPLTGFAMLAVLARNYRSVTNANDRRRLRWVVGGTVIGLVPFLAIQVANVAGRVLGTPLNLQPFFAPANLATTAIPLSFGYAIIKHRVFDITLVVRRGLQYLLAKNALRALLLLPAAGLAYGLFVHRDEPIGRLLLTNSPYLYLMVGALVSLRFRARLTRWLDSRFFREAYDRERILVGLIEDLDKLESASTASKLVSHELEAAFHPTCLFVWYREANRPVLTLSYSSGGYIHATELSEASRLREIAVGASGVVELPLKHPDQLPVADRAWLEESGVRLLVPMKSDNRELLGLLMLGDKKSEEPYSGDDLKLLLAIARQIAVARENLRLKERVQEDRRIQHDVLAQLETGHISLVRECPSCGACYDADVSRCAADGAELQVSLPVERTIDRKYRLDRLIGRGGMGAVYEAADVRLGRRVAIKILTGRGLRNHEALRRFEREAHACASLAHPNIVTVFDYGGAGGNGAFLVMELVRGRTLRAELQRVGRVSPDTLASWFEQICAAVAAAHQRRIVHRDLKPENVLIGTDAAGADLIKVLDFGLAKFAGGEPGSASLTEAGAVMGTIGYMAPEQLTAGAIDERSDVFALGVMAVEALTGRRPFRGRTHTELLAAILNERWTIAASDPEWRRLESVLQRALAKDPNARYPSVASFSEDLMPALRAAAVAAESASNEETRI
jgi:eukaryotic-like serine/threonine-protein kinase